MNGFEVCVFFSLRGCVVLKACLFKMHLNTPKCVYIYIFFSGHKTDSFVGLMGKRSLNSGMYATESVL